MKKKLIIFSLILFFSLFAFIFRNHQNYIRLNDNIQGFIRPYAEKLVNELNHTYSLKQKYVFYVANFEANQLVPKITNANDEKSILWLGSVANISMQDLYDFDIVLASTPELRDFVKSQNINAYYLPIFALPKDNTSSNYKFIAVVGNPPRVEEELIRKKIFYRQYGFHNLDKLAQDLPYIKAAFINNVDFQTNSLDLPPVFLEMALMNIPMITNFNFSYDYQHLHLFNDNINFYLSYDIAQLIDNVSQNAFSYDMKKRQKSAKIFVENYFSLKSATDTLLYILDKKQQPPMPILPNSLNIDIPVAVGHLSTGDYWLARDLLTSVKQNFNYTNISFFNSFMLVPSEINILVSGFLPKTYDNKQRIFNGKKNIVYVAYAQFPETKIFNGDNILFKKEDILDENLYLQQLENLSRDNDVNALAIASESLAKKLNERGVKAYYIPQFTNTARFYPDYDEKLKSDVFFVGVNVFYRKAVPAVLKAGLPITIYGPNWNGLAKGDYIDNRELYKYYSSAKIVLNDTREGMKKLGFISNRIFDVTATGTLMISDYMKEIEEVYGDCVPMWKTEEELVELVKYYLAPEHEAERLAKAKCARDITLKNFTSDIAAQKFMQIIDDIKKQKVL